MPTVRDLCEAALRRLRITAAGETASAEDAGVALDAYNRMLRGWAGEGVNVEHQTAALGDAFRLFRPAAAVLGATLGALAYQGTWDANANSPVLASGVGTQGHLYRVATAGTTTLDGVSSWAVDDYLVYDATAWLKGASPLRHEQAVVDLLAVQLADEFGKELPPVLARSAASSWRTISADYIRVDPATFDGAVVLMPSRRYLGILQ